MKGKLSMFWFRDVEFEVANRHGQGPAPLISQGYMVTSGVHGLCCLDAYNGRKLWEFDVKNLLIDFDGIHHDVGIGDTGGPFCIGGDSVYVKSGPRCLRIDLATGKLVALQSQDAIPRLQTSRLGGLAALHHRHQHARGGAETGGNAHHKSLRHQH